MPRIDLAYKTEKFLDLYVEHRLTLHSVSHILEYLDKCLPLNHSKTPIK